MTVRGVYYYNWKRETSSRAVLILELEFTSFTCQCEEFLRKECKWDSGEREQGEIKNVPFKLEGILTHRHLFCHF